MKITQEVRDYAAGLEMGAAGQEAVIANPEQGMQEKSREFREQGAEVYQKR
jgi:phosphomethylpyrimidine synthase